MAQYTAPSTNHRVHLRAWEHLANEEQQIFGNEMNYGGFIDHYFHKKNNAWFLKNDLQLTKYGNSQTTIGTVFDENKKIGERKHIPYKQGEMIKAFTRQLPNEYTEAFEKWQSRMEKNDRHDRDYKVYPRAFNDLSAEMKNAFGNETRYVKALRRTLNIELQADGTTQAYLKDNRLVEFFNYQRFNVTIGYDSNTRQFERAKGLNNWAFVKELSKPYESEEQQKRFEQSALETTRAIRAEIAPKLKPWDEMSDEQKIAIYTSSSQYITDVSDPFEIMKRAYTSPSSNLDSTDFPVDMLYPDSYDGQSTDQKGRVKASVKSSRPSYVVVDDGFSVVFHSFSAGKQKPINVFREYLDDFGRNHYNSNKVSAEAPTSEQMQILEEKKRLREQVRKEQARQKEYMNKYAPESLYAAAALSELLAIRQSKIAPEIEQTKAYTERKRLDPAFDSSVLIPHSSKDSPSLFRSFQDRPDSYEKRIEDEIARAFDRTDNNTTYLEANFGLDNYHEWRSRHQFRLSEMGIEFNNNGLLKGGLTQLQEKAAEFIFLKRDVESISKEVDGQIQPQFLIYDDQNQVLPKTKAMASSGTAIVTSYRLAKDEQGDTRIDLASGQFILPVKLKSGEDKFTMTGADSSHGFALSGHQFLDSEDADLLDMYEGFIFAEGHATAASIRKRMTEEEREKYGVIVAFNATALPNVYEDFHNYFPNKEMIVAIDNDRYKIDKNSGMIVEKPGNTGVNTFAQIKERFPEAKAMISNFNRMERYLEQRVNQYNAENPNAAPLSAADMHNKFLLASDFNDAEVLAQDIFAKTPLANDDRTLDSYYRELFDLSEGRLQKDTAAVVEFYNNLPDEKKHFFERNAIDDNDTEIVEIDYFRNAQNRQLVNSFNFQRSAESLQYPALQDMPTLSDSYHLNNLVTPVQPNNNAYQGQAYHASTPNAARGITASNDTPSQMQEYDLSKIPASLMMGRAVDITNRNFTNERQDYFNDAVMQVIDVVKDDNGNDYLLGVSLNPNGKRAAARTAIDGYTGEVSQDIIRARLSTPQELQTLTAKVRSGLSEEDVATLANNIHAKNVEHLTRNLEANKNNYKGMIVNLRAPTTLDFHQVTNGYANTGSNTNTDSTRTNVYDVAYQGLSVLASNLQIQEKNPMQFVTGAMNIEVKSTYDGKPAVYFNHAVAMEDFLSPEAQEDNIGRTIDHMNPNKRMDEGIESNPYVEFQQPSFSVNYQLTKDGRSYNEERSFQEHPIRMFLEKRPTFREAVNEDGSTRQIPYSEPVSFDATVMRYLDMRDSASQNFFAALNKRDNPENTPYENARQRALTPGQHYEKFLASVHIRNYLIASGLADKYDYDFNGDEHAHFSELMASNLVDENGQLSKQHQSLIRNVEAYSMASQRALLSSERPLQLLGEQYFTAGKLATAISDSYNGRSNEARLNSLTNFVKEVSTSDVMRPINGNVIEGNANTYTSGVVIAVRPSKRDGEINDNDSALVVTNFGGLPNTNNKAQMTNTSFSLATDSQSHRRFKSYNKTAAKSNEQFADEIYKAFIARSFQAKQDESIIDNPKLFNAAAIAQELTVMSDAKNKPVMIDQPIKLGQASYTDTGLYQVINIANSVRLGDVEGAESIPYILATALEDKDYRDSARPMFEHLSEIQDRRTPFAERISAQAQAVLGYIRQFDQEGINRISPDRFNSQLGQPDRLVYLTNEDTLTLKEELFKASDRILAGVVPIHKSNELLNLGFDEGKVQSLRTRQRAEDFDHVLLNDGTESDIAKSGHLRPILHDMNNHLNTALHKRLKEVNVAKASSNVIYMTFNENDFENMQNLVNSSEYSKLGLNPETSNVFLVGEKENARNAIAMAHGSTDSLATVIVVNRQLPPPQIAQQGTQVLPSNRNYNGVFIDFNQDEAMQAGRLAIGMANGESKRLKDYGVGNVSDVFSRMVTERLRNHGGVGRDLVDMVKISNPSLRTPYTDSDVRNAYDAITTDNWETFDRTHNIALDALIRQAKTPQFNAIMLVASEVLNRNNQPEAAAALKNLSSMTSSWSLTENKFALGQQDDPLFNEAKPSINNENLAILTLATMLSENEAEQVRQELSSTANKLGYNKTMAQEQDLVAQGLIAAIQQRSVGVEDVGAPKRMDVVISYDQTDEINPHVKQDANREKTFDVEKRLTSYAEAVRAQTEESKLSDTFVLSYGKDIDYSNDAIEAKLVGESFKQPATIEPRQSTNSDFIFSDKQLQYLKDHLADDPNAAQKYENATGKPAPDVEILMAKVVHTALADINYQSAFVKTTRDLIQKIDGNVQYTQELTDLNALVKQTPGDVIDNKVMPSDWPVVKEVATDILVRMSVGDVNVVAPNNKDDVALVERSVEEFAGRYRAATVSPQPFSHRQGYDRHEIALYAANAAGRIFDQYSEFNDDGSASLYKMTNDKPAFLSKLTESINNNPAFVRSSEILQFGENAEKLHEEQKGLRSLNKLTERGFINAINKDDDRSVQQQSRILLAATTPSSEDTAEAVNRKQQMRKLFQVVLQFEGSQESLELLKNLDKYDVNETTKGFRLSTNELTTDNTTEPALQLMKKILTNGNDIIPNHQTGESTLKETAYKDIAAFAKRHRKVDAELVEKFIAAPTPKGYENNFQTAAVVAANRQYDAILELNRKDAELLNENAKRYHPTKIDGVYQQVDNNVEWDNNKRLERSTQAVLKGGTANAESIALAVATIAKHEPNFAKTAEKLLSFNQTDTAKALSEVIKTAPQLPSYDDINDAKLTRMYELATVAVVSAVVREEAHTSRARNQDLARTMQQFAATMDNSTPNFYGEKFIEAAEQLSRNLPESGVNNTWAKSKDGDNSLIDYMKLEIQRKQPAETANIEQSNEATITQTQEVQQQRPGHRM